MLQSERDEKMRPNQRERGEKRKTIGARAFAIGLAKNHDLPTRGVRLLIMPISLQHAKSNADVQCEGSEETDLISVHFGTLRNPMFRVARKSGAAMESRELRSRHRNIGEIGETILAGSWRQIYQTKFSHLNGINTCGKFGESVHFLTRKESFLRFVDVNSK